MFNEGQKCIIELVDKNGSQVWSKARVDRIERGLAVVQISQGCGDVTAWFPDMDGAWNVDADGMRGYRFRIWSEDTKTAHFGAKVSERYERLCRVLGPFEDSAHCDGETIDPNALFFAAEIDALIRKAELLASKLSIVVEEAVASMTRPVGQNKPKMSRQQVAQYLVGQRIDRGWSVCNLADVTGLKHKKIERFERRAMRVPLTDEQAERMFKDGFMRRYAEQVGGVEMVDRIAR